MNGLSKIEKEFIQSKLKDQEVEIGMDKNGDLTISENKNKQKKKKHVIGYKNPKMWVIFFMLLPIGLVFCFALMLAYTKSFLGDGFDYFMENRSSETIQLLSQQSGFEWIPVFINVYDYRYLYVIITFTVFFSISLLIMFIDYKKYKNSPKEIDDIIEDSEV